MAEAPDSQDLVFFDTNVLLYLFDRDAERKRQLASELFKKHQQSGSLRLSLQVVHEFAANLLKKKFGIPLATVVGLVTDLLTLEVALPQSEDTMEALEFMHRFGVTFWDGLILAAAKRTGCAVLYSEDFQDGRVYDTVKIVNPFPDGS